MHLTSFSTVTVKKKWSLKLGNIKKYGGMTNFEKRIKRNSPSIIIELKSTKKIKEMSNAKLLTAGLDKFFSKRPIGHAKKRGAQNQSQCVHLIEKQLETIIFVLRCNSIKSFCTKSFVMWILFECLRQDASQKTMLTLQAHPSKGVQKNMLKAWNFNKHKLCHRYLKKNCRTNILQSNTAQLLLIVVLMVGLFLDN